MFNIHEMAWAVINFIVFFLILRLVFFKPVLKMLDSRREEVEGNLARAQEERDAADKLRQEYQERLAASQGEAEEIRTRASRIAEEARAQVLARADADAARLVERAQEGIRRERDQVLADLREQAADIVSSAAARVLGRVLTPEDHRRLQEEFVDRVGEDDA
jgi:F-type H+-transporting ATPase subunit b